MGFIVSLCKGMETGIEVVSWSGFERARDAYLRGATGVSAILP